MKFVALTLLACSFAFVSVAQEAPEKVDPTVAQGREWTQLFYQGELSKIYKLFTAEMQGTMTMDRFRQSRRQVSETLGVEKTLHDERVEKREGGYLVYMREATFEKTSDRFRVIWAIRDGQIGGFFIRPVDDALITPTPEG